MGDEERVWRVTEPEERHDALDALTTSVRRLVEATVRTGQDPATLRKVADEVDALTERLDEVADDDPWVARSTGLILDDPGGFMGINPAMGRRNPIAPVVHAKVDGAAVRGTVRFDLQHVGPPYRGHGGIVASVLDQVLGVAAIAGGSPGMTAEMTVRYRRATPIEEDLRYEARMTEVDGLTSRATGEIYDADGRVTAEAEATFRQPKGGIR